MDEHLYTVMNFATHTRRKGKGQNPGYYYKIFLANCLLGFACWGLFHTFSDTAPSGLPKKKKDIYIYILVSIIMMSSPHIFFLFFFFQGSIVSKKRIVFRRFAARLMFNPG